MADSASDARGLHVKRLGKNKAVVMDADNVFWGIVEGTDGADAFIPDKLLSLYERVRKRCDREMKQFRFSRELTAVYIDPTDLCNADCPYCYVPVRIRKHGRSMTEQELCLVLRKAAAYFKRKRRKAVIVFHASEPLLVKEMLFRVINKFRDQFHFGIQTNALLLEKEDAEFLRSHRVSVGISLDAADAATNDRLRFSAKAGGNFQKAVQAIEWFRGYRGLNVITTMTNLNVKKLPALVRFLHGKGVGCVLINPVRLTQRNSHRLRPGDGVMARYFIKAVKESMKCSGGSRHRIVVGNFANIILAIIAPRARRLMCDISPCGGGRCFLTITASGDMVPCGEFIGIRGFSGGNIFRGSIAGAMSSKAFERVRSRFVEKIPGCDVCLLRNICGAPCPAELHALGGMYKRAVFCEFYKEVIAYALKLIAGGKEKQLLREEALGNLKYEYVLD